MNQKYDKDNYYYIVDDFTIHTMGDLVGKPDGILFNKDINKILDWKSTTDKDRVGTNREFILAGYTSDKKQQKILADLSVNNPSKLPIKLGTVLLIPKSELNSVALKFEGLNTVLTDSRVFKSDALLKLENNQNYKKTTIKYKDGQQLSVRHNQATVWVWCKALRDNRINVSKPYEIEGKWLNVTPFIVQLNSSVTSSGGNFNFVLAPVSAEWNNHTKSWDIKRANTIEYTHKNVKNILYTDFLQYKDTNEYKDNIYLFHHLIQPNDFAVIWYEHLDSEKVDRPEVTGDFLIRDELDLTNQSFDMMGLVDTTNVQVSEQGNTGSVQVQGRDLMKLIIDESTLFYASQFAENKFFTAGGNSTEFQNRLFEGQLIGLNMFLQNTIQDTVKYILKNLSGMRILPDKMIKTTFGSDVKSFNTQIESIEPAINNERKKINSKFKEDILNDIKYYRSSARLGIANSDETLEKDNIDECFNLLASKAYSALNNTPSKLNASGYIDVNDGNLDTGTYNNLLLCDGDYSADIYQDNFLQTIVNNVAKYVYVDFLIQNEREYKNTDYMNGIWALLNLSIDPTVATLRVIDSSIATISGSLIQFFKKICMEPFIEFFGDTYNNGYYLTIRKAPFDQKSILSSLNKEENIFDLKEKDEVIKFDHLVIDVENQDIKNRAFVYDDNQTYSWYHVRTPNTLGGEQAALFMIAPIVFPELISLWGNKPCDVMHNYLPYYQNNYSEDINNANKIELQLFQDLKYIIDSHMYLPFSRKGQIVVEGDRRIKKGNWIRFKPTGEIFYVESVGQSYGISQNGEQKRLTTIEVSHGLVEKYIKGVEVEGIGLVSYFNIANTNLRPASEYTVTRKEKKKKTVIIYEIRDKNNKPIGKLKFDNSTDAAKALGYRAAQFIDNSDGSFGRDKKDIVKPQQDQETVPTFTPFQSTQKPVIIPFANPNDPNKPQTTGDAISSTLSDLNAGKPYIKPVPQKINSDANSRKALLEAIYKNLISLELYVITKRYEGEPFHSIHVDTIARDENKTKQYFNIGYGHQFEMGDADWKKYNCKFTPGTKRPQFSSKENTRIHDDKNNTVETVGSDVIDDKEINRIFIQDYKEHFDRMANHTKFYELTNMPFNDPDGHMMSPKKWAVLTDIVYQGVTQEIPALIIAIKDYLIELNRVSKISKTDYAANAIQGAIHPTGEDTGFFAQKINKVVMDNLENAFLNLYLSNKGKRMYGLRNSNRFKEFISEDPFAAGFANTVLPTTEQLEGTAESLLNGESMLGKVGGGIIKFGLYLKDLWENFSFDDSIGAIDSTPNAQLKFNNDEQYHLISTEKEIETNEEITITSIDRSKMFESIKVNPEVLNFFITRQQLRGDL